MNTKTTLKAKLKVVFCLEDEIKQRERLKAERIERVKLIRKKSTKG